jgi:hypothetical protein
VTTCFDFVTFVFAFPGVPRDGDDTARIVSIAVPADSLQVPCLFGLGPSVHAGFMPWKKFTVIFTDKFTVNSLLAL